MIWYSQHQLELCMRLNIQIFQILNLFCWRSWQTDPCEASLCMNCRRIWRRSMNFIWRTASGKKERESEKYESVSISRRRNAPNWRIWLWTGKSNGVWSLICSSEKACRWMIFWWDRISLKLQENVIIRIIRILISLIFCGP